MKRFCMCLLLALALSVNALALEVPTSTVVQNLNGSQQLIKTFVLSPDKDPQELIEKPFEQEGFLYTFADIVKDENHVADTTYHRETVTVETSTNDLSKILEQLESSIYYDDGTYKGTLALDHTSIRTEASGYETRSSTVTATKTIGPVDRNDMSYVPAKEAEQWSEPRSVPVLTESGELKTVQGYIQCKPFWSFDNSDATGRPSFDFANNGQIDLRDNRWKETLEGHIRFALAKEQQLRHIGRSGGLGALREADDVYNNLNRELIAALKLMHGTAFLGDVNFYGEDHKLVATGQKSVYEEYTGQMVYNFGCSFCVPTADETLEELIRAWNSNDTLPKKRINVSAIVDRVKEIGGINLLWY